MMHCNVTHACDKIDSEKDSVKEIFLNCSPVKQLQTVDFP